MTQPSQIQRVEVDREDLMREATALRQRAEFDVPGEKEPVIAGYRSNLSLSLYFGPDPCFHFDPSLKLRRAFVDGDLYRTQGTTLARLHRDRSSGIVELQRYDLSPIELNHFIERIKNRLNLFAASLDDMSAICLQQFPKNVDLQERLNHDLKRLLDRPVALAPPIRGKH